MSEDWDHIEEAGPNGIYLDGIIVCQKGNCIAWVSETTIDLSFIGNDPEVWARTKQTFAALSATGYVDLSPAGKLTIKPHCKFMESGKGGA